MLLDGNCYLGNEPELKILHQLGLPVILGHAYPEDVAATGFPGFGCDLKRAWLAGLETIHETGVKRIALLLCSSDGRTSRRRSFEEHLRLLGNCRAESDPELLQCCANVSEPDSARNITAAVEKLCAPEQWFGSSPVEWQEIPYKICRRASIGKGTNHSGMKGGRK